MARLLPRLVVATHNAGKMAEFTTLLSPYCGEILSAADLNLPETQETGETFFANAALKAHAVAAPSGYAALADDSGLCVTALNGAPGIFSGRYAEQHGKRDFAYAMQSIHREIGDASDRSAEFVCVLVLAVAGETHSFEGRLRGTIVWPPRGGFGHGYDPFFQPDGETRTYAEMSEDEKNAISHRGLATRKLIAWLDADNGV